MGYACPVCETPQADAGHLANHLAFTAMLGDEDHEAWLDEHASGWNEAGERELADRVVEHASEVEFPQVFEDTTGQERHEHDHDEPRPGALFEDDDRLEPRGRAGASEAGTSCGIDAGTADDPEIEQAMTKAREMTRQRRGDGEDTDDENDRASEDADRENTGSEDAAEGGGDESQ